MTEGVREATDGCRVLEWDSEFFGVRIARVDPEVVQCGAGTAVDAWCGREGVECAYLLVDLDDQVTQDIAQARGFRLVDVRVTLQAAPLSTVRPPLKASASRVRVAQPDDVRALRIIARASHRDGRFYADGHFDRLRCDEFYAVWVANSCNGWADMVLVSQIDDSVVGYLTCHLRAPHDGQMGLVAVDSKSRAQGAGTGMVQEALRWFSDHEVRHVRVVTQGRNAPALRFYQRAGFSVGSLQLWYHKWFDRTRA